MVLTLDQTQATDVQTAITDITNSNLYKGDGTTNSWSDIMEVSPTKSERPNVIPSRPLTAMAAPLKSSTLAAFSDFRGSIPAPEPTRRLNRIRT